MSILQICAFAAPTSGNFIRALLALENAANEYGKETIYAFPERAMDKPWCIELMQHAKVYFLPESHARISLAAYRAVKRIFKENSISIVHSHFELYDMHVALLAPKEAKIFWHLHDPLQDTQTNAPLSRRILNKIQYKYFSKRTKLLSVSKKHAEYVATLGFNHKNIIYLPNGIDTSRINVTNPNTPYQRFLLFGWDVFRKGVDVAIEAARDVQNEKFELTIIGQEKCKEYVEKANCSKVTFSAPVEDINQLYNTHDVFLHISRSEGQSYALLEALYSGIYVISSDIPENEFAKEFKNVAWISNASVNDLKQLYHSFLNNEQSYDSNGLTYNRTIIDNKYSISAWVNTVLKLYFN